MAANLTTVAIQTRKVIRYGVLFIILMILARTVLSIGVSVYKAVVPKPTLPPTAQFGPLPALPFPKPNQDLPTLNVNVETATGKIPVFATQANVYYMPPYATNLFSFDNAGRKAKAMGFDGQPLQLSETLYRYTSGATPSTLEMNIVTNAFSISYNLDADPSPLSQISLTADAASQQVKQLLASAGLLPEDIVSGSDTSDYLKVEGQNLVHAISLSEANFVKINLFRKTYNELPPVTADPNRGTIWFIVAGGDKNKSIIAAQYRYYPIDEKRFESYPIKTTQQALDELKAGKGYIANLGVNQDGNVTIRNISLAYYDSEESMQFYEPVFVFKGDRDFVAYVPAVTAQYYGK